MTVLNASLTEGDEFFLKDSRLKVIACVTVEHHPNPHQRSPPLPPSTFRLLSSPPFLSLAYLEWLEEKTTCQLAARACSAISTHRPRSRPRIWGPELPER
jgi:hypothetical protein